MAQPRQSALYQVRTRVLLTDLSNALGRPATLDDIPDAELDRIAARGFDWVWLLSVWSTGETSRAIPRALPDLRREFARTLPDLSDDDIDGSGFAIRAYTVEPRLGGEDALARFRARLRQRGLALMLDFVPNHVALDHPWINESPAFFVRGGDADLEREPGNYVRVPGAGIVAHGRDPYFAGWTDTLQLDYSNPALQTAMTGVLLDVAARCDGVRCDMAMLVLPDVFERTWGRRPEPFWPAAIGAVRARRPGFVFLAEVYWDLEPTLLELGFDYAYDKRLYDRLRHADADAVRAHLRADPAYQERLARFLENHDEPRAAAAFEQGRHEAAAVVTYLSPGLRFFHQGQLEGRRARLPPQLVRAPAEPVDPALAAFYERLLAVVNRPEVRDGRWRLLEAVPAWDGNPTSASFIAWTWTGAAGVSLLVVVNLAGHRGQCYVRVPDLGSTGRSVRLADLLGPDTYDRASRELASKGLYLDLPPWGYHAFVLHENNV